MFRPADGIVELTKQLALLANQQPGVADDIDEQDVSNLEPERAFGFSRHKVDECKIASNETTARSTCSLKLHCSRLALRDAAQKMFRRAMRHHVAHGDISRHSKIAPDRLRKLQRGMQRRGHNGSRYFTPGAKTR